MERYLKCGRFVNEEVIFMFEDNKNRNNFIELIKNDTNFKYFNAWYKEVSKSELTQDELDHFVNEEYYNI